MWDLTGKEYLDFNSGVASIIAGHSHPKVREAINEQFDKICMTFRFVHTENLGSTLAHITDYFGFDEMVLSNTGTEAGEAVIKIARKWAYVSKGVPDNQARVLFPNGNFWGSSIAACASCSDPDRRDGFGPFGGLGFDMIDYNDLPAFEEYIERNGEKLAAYYVEPIQGDAGIIIPDEDYFPRIRELCDKHNVLLIFDEVQTGMGRTGKKLGYHHFGVRADAITLGKGFGGGHYPLAGVLASREIMDCMTYGPHATTYAASPIACAVATSMINILEEEKLVENSRDIGSYLLGKLKGIKSPLVKDVRGKGLLIGLEYFFC